MFFYALNTSLSLKVPAVLLLYACESSSGGRLACQVQDTLDAAQAGGRQVLESLGGSALERVARSGWRCNGVYGLQKLP